MKKAFTINRTNFSYGWVVVGASALLMGGVFGALASFGVFLKPLIEEFGWTRAMISGAMSISMAVYGFAGIMIGRLTDKYGARMLLLFGALVGGLGYLLMSHLGSIWQLYIYFGLCTGVCLGSSWIPINATVSRWFVEKRVLALGLVSIGIAAGCMLLPPLVAYIITGDGWSLAYIVLAIVVCIAAVPAVILLGRNPPQGNRVAHRGGANTGTDGEVGESIQPRVRLAAEVARTTPFWMLMINGFVCGAGFYFVVVHIVAYATDVGIPATLAAIIITFTNGASIVGTLLAWPITARLGNRVTLLLFLAAQAVALFFFVWAVNLWMFFALAALFGFGFGGATPTRTAMIPQLFGMEAVGTIIGLVTFAWTAGGITGPILAAYIFDMRQSYDVAFLAGGLLLIIGMLSAYFLHGRDGQPGGL